MKFIDANQNFDLDLNNKLIIGVDESGVGDYFGPLCAAAVLIPLNNYQKVLNLGVTDSKKISNNKIYLTIKEGKFHQVKRMLEAINNKVCYLKRMSFGKLKLNNLALGEVKEVNLEDII